MCLDKPLILIYYKRCVRRHHKPNVLYFYLYTKDNKEPDYNAAMFDNALLAKIIADPVR